MKRHADHVTYVSVEFLENITASTNIVSMISLCILVIA